MFDSRAKGINGIPTPDFTFVTAKYTFTAATCDYFTFAN